MLLDRIAADVPAESVPLLTRLLGDPLRPEAELVAEIEAYLGFVRSYAETYPEIDVGRIDWLADRCRKLVEATRGASEDDRRLAQVACLYFVAIEGDLDQGDGFADDEAVIRAVESATLG
jgi:hypothetical protein